MRSTRRPLAAVLLLTLLAAFGCGKSNDHVVAKVGNDEITLGDFNIAYTGITIFSRPPLLTYEDKERFLQTVINKNIMVQEAIARGYDKDPDLIAKREAWEQERMLRALYKEIADKDLEVTLPEVEAHYKKSRAKIRARHILVATPEEALEIRAALSEGGDFAELARARSMDEGTARLGGDLGFVLESNVEGPVKQAAVGLDVDELSPIIQSNKGYHIVQCVFRQEPSMDDFEDQRPVCAAELRNQRRNQRWQGHNVEQIEVRKIVHDDEVITQLNAMLPERGFPDRSWESEVTDEFRAAVVTTYDEGQWTVGDFMAHYSPEKGIGQAFQSNRGDLIRRTTEMEILTANNIRIAREMGLDKNDQVAREIQKKFEQELLTRLYEDITKDLEIDEADAREIFEEQGDELTMDESVTFIYVNVADAALAKRIHAEAASGVELESLARKYNTGPLKEKGGLIGPVTRTGLNAPELATYLFDQGEPGTISPVLATEATGFFVVKLLEKIPPHPMSFEEARPTIEAQLMTVMREEAIDEFLETKRAEIGVQIFPEVLNLLSEGEDEEVGVS
ncbi:MAG: hypothetical protein HKN20_05770 [Gemmatimonadetes bacterium]|nr:hypothetical protein [Gemmatimonadota bacterium]